MFLSIVCTLHLWLNKPVTLIQEAQINGTHSLHRCSLKLHMFLFVQLQYSSSIVFITPLLWNFLQLMPDSYYYKHTCQVLL